MNKKFFSGLMIAPLVFLNVGCVHEMNSHMQAASIEEAHPITVDSQVVTLTIAVDRSMGGVSNIDAARIRAFSEAFLRDGHGTVTVTAPSGATGDLAGQELASAVRDQLHQAGVSWSDMTGTTYRAAGGQENSVILSFTHYVATPSPCGVWHGLKKAERRNLRTPNYGCATQNNIAAMVADPRDLVEPAAMSAPDSTGRIRAIEQFRSGNISSVKTDDAIAVSTEE